jgi:hypothetical protein
LLGGLSQSEYSQKNTNELIQEFKNWEASIGWFRTKIFLKGEWKKVYSIRITTDTSKNVDTNRDSYTHQHSNLNKYNYSGIAFSANNSNEELIESHYKSFYTFEFDRWEGSGYKFGKKTSLRFLYGNNMVWGWFNINDSAPPQDPELICDCDNPINLMYLENGVRFGKKLKSEINWQVYDGLSLVANANRTIIFPRTKFLHWTVSESIFSIGELLIDIFTDEIATNSPKLYPIVDFILKTGLNFGISELQKKNMNWPMKGEIPFVMDNVRVGIQFTF